MNKSPLKYTIAWDRVTDKFITPDEVNRAEAHDTNRYFSEKFDINEDKGYVLTLHKKSKEYSSKNGKTISRRAHFVRLADNTREYRIETEKKAKAQESVVHKLCKEVIKDISNIKIPNLYANILGEKLLLIPEQIIPIKLISIERKDTTSGTIPDATVETVIFGKKQKLYIEFFYKHEVDEAKRLQFNFYNQNCIEIDLSDLRDNLDLSEKALKKLIKEKIEND